MSHSEMFTNIGIINANWNFLDRVCGLAVTVVDMAEASFIEQLYIIYMKVLRKNQEIFIYFLIKISCNL